VTALLAERDPMISLTQACSALGVSRATLHRRKQAPAVKPPRAKPVSARALSEAQRAEVLDVLHSPEFVDQPPREVYGTLLANDTYLCSVRTMYRLLTNLGESRERRDQRAPVHHAVPRLSATAPDQVWTWDITKLATLTTGVFLNLYLILDLFSRCIVGWMVARRETTALAQQLIIRSIERAGIAGGQLTLHNDRGAPMTAHTFDAMLTTLGIEASRSRPRVSNDNAFSESGFKTLKYQPDFPGRFRDTQHARSWMREFTPWYNEEHRHEGLNGFTPDEVYSGRHVELAIERQATLDAAHARHPERWINKPPVLPKPPAMVSINPAPPMLANASTAAANEVIPVEPGVVSYTNSHGATCT
jgi:putative transposase